MADEAKVGGPCPMVPVFHHGPVPPFHYSNTPLFQPDAPARARLLPPPSRGQACYAPRNDRREPGKSDPTTRNCAKQSQFGRGEIEPNCCPGKWLRGQCADCGSAKTKPISTRRVCHVPVRGTWGDARCCVSTGRAGAGYYHYSSIPPFHHSIPEPRVSRAGEPACKTKPIFRRDK